MHRTLAHPAAAATTGVSGPLRIVPGRLDSVDRLRGVVIVLMTLDHVRDFFTNPPYDPTDLAHTTLPLFVTRWVTHFCAPTFIFLAGIGAYLSMMRGRTKPQLAWFLLTRGLWIVILELTVVRSLGWAWTLDFHGLMGSILWAIGWCMMALAGLIFLPIWLLAALSLVMIAGHNTVDGITADRFGQWRWLWAVLHSGDELQPFPGYRFLPAYPLIPWNGVMALGYTAGTLYRLEVRRRRACLFGLGVSCIVTFVALRWSNVYGDTTPWSVQRNPALTICSFVNCRKYPPSLLYLLMTLGPALLALAWFEREPLRWAQPLVTFGRVPLFYYLLHLPLAHALAAVLAVIRYGPGLLTAKTLPADYGYGLPVVYLMWIVTTLILYPLCRWYAGVKRRSRNRLLSYL